MKYWTTQNGEEIAYKKLEDEHLLNILNMIKIKAKKGITIVSGGGGWDIDDCWYDEEEIKGAEVLKYFDYASLLKEAKKRDLIKNGKPVKI
jgi:hypothetical protein